MKRSVELRSAVSRIFNPQVVRNSGRVRISAFCRMQFGDTAGQICAKKEHLK